MPRDKQFSLKVNNATKEVEISIDGELTQLEKNDITNAIKKVLPKHKKTKEEVLG